MKVLKIMMAVVLACGMAFAAGTPTSDTVSKSAFAANASGMTAGMGFSLGTLLLVNQSVKTLIIKTSRGQDTVIVSDATRIRVQGKPGTWADLYAGSTVAVVYQLTNGVKVAVRISEKTKKSIPKASGNTNK
jgi:hypothetical protein